MLRRTAVIGGGMAGMACAAVLRRAGCAVEVFEQEPVIGGRLATTRLGITAFDHGAQYITARSAPFRAYVDELVGSAYAKRWAPADSKGSAQPQLVPWFVGTPGMSSLIRPLAMGVRLHTGRAVHSVHQADKGWQVVFEDESAAGPFDAVAVATPAQLARILLGAFEEFDNIARVRIQPCWSVLARLEERVLPNQDVYSDMSEVVRWIARNNSKPGRRPLGDHVVIHASPGWSRETEDLEPEIVATELWNEVSNVLDLPPSRPAQLGAHLWRYGIVEQPLGETYMYSHQRRIGAAGDWCLGRMTEHAYESGIGLAKSMLASLD